MLLRQRRRMHMFNSVYRIKIIFWLSHHLSELNRLNSLNSLNSVNSLNSFVLSVTDHSHSVNINHHSRKALLQWQLSVMSAEEQCTAFMISHFKHLFRIMLTLFKLHLIVSLHLLTVRLLLQLHSHCRTLLFQRNTEIISVISIKVWLNYDRMNVFSAMKSDLT